MLVGVGRDGAGRVADSGELWAAVAEYVAQVTPAGCTVDVRYLDAPLGDLGNAYDRTVVELALADDAIEAERLGYAAALMAPALDPGLSQARSRVDIPVVGTFEAGMMLSQMYGRHVGVVTVRRRFIAKLRENIRAYGLEGRLVCPGAIEAFELDYTDYVAALRGDGAELAAKYAVAARALVDRGADVIVGAHQLLGVAFARCGYDHASDIGVPYIDCLAAGVAAAAAAGHLAEAAGLRQSRHVNSIFRTPSAHDSDVPER